MIAILSNRSDYACDGLQTSFPITFEWSLESEIHVWLRTVATGAQVELSSPTQWDIDGDNVVTVATYSAAYQLTILRETGIEQSVAVPANRSVETALDEVVKMIRDNRERLGRAALLKETSPYSELELPEPQPNYNLAWNELNQLVNIQYLHSGGANMTALAKTLVGLAAAGDWLTQLGVSAFIQTLLPAADAGAARTTLDAAASSHTHNPFHKGYLYGLEISNSAGDPNNDIDVASGECVDSTGAAFLDFTALTKQLDAAWAAGTNAGGLDTGTKAVSTTYHVFVILKDSDDSVDALFSTSPSSPTMPSGYTYFRRIGSILTDGSGNIRLFRQTGNLFMLDVPVVDVSWALIPNATRNLATITAPAGTRAILRLTSYCGTNSRYFKVEPTWVVDVAADSTNAGYTYNGAFSHFKTVELDASRQVAYRASHGAVIYMLIQTHGWIDERDFVQLSPGSRVVAVSGTARRGHLFGLTLSNNAADPNNDIDVAAGEAVDPDTGNLLATTGGMTKRLDATWAAGHGNGGLDTGSKAVDTWYHVWMIGYVATGAVDFLFSASATAPSMPTGWTQKRRIGAVLTDASGNILAFKQTGDWFKWVTPPMDINGTYSTSRVLVTISVPDGFKILARGTLQKYNASTHPLVYVGDPDNTDAAPANVPNTTDRATQPGAAAQFVHTMVRSNVSSQIAVRASTASTTIVWAVHEYEDRRGRE